MYEHIKVCARACVCVCVCLCVCVYPRPGLVRYVRLLRNGPACQTIPARMTWLTCATNLSCPGHSTQENGRASEERARDIFAQLVRAMSYCHANRVAHRDLKPENVVFCIDPETRAETIKVRTGLPSACFGRAARRWRGSRVAVVFASRAGTEPVSG